MGDKSEAQEPNLEFWMNELPQQLKDIPLIYLAIPGSHDSMTFSINRSSGLAPDAEPLVRRVYPLFRGTIIRWTITQALDTWQQLLIGIRYFDLRLATKENEENFYFTHGVYADEISKPLQQVRDFVDSHPGEVVILDCQHLYGFQPADHQRLMRFLLRLFGPRLVPRKLDLQTITLNSLGRLKQQVIVVYRNESVWSSGELWAGSALPSPWPRQAHPAGLRAFLRNVTRSPTAGFVHQAVLTPTPAFIVLRWTSNLKDKCAIPVLDEVLPELSEFAPGPPRLGHPSEGRAPVNVVIADFVDLHNALFPRTIIALNQKLLRNTDFVYHNHG